MYKFISLIFLQVFFLTKLVGQDFSSVDLDFIIPDQEDVIVLSPSAHFSFNNHEWSIGPTMLLSFGDQLEDRDGFKLTGLNIGYENYLHGKGDKWTLFHSMNLIIQRVKDEQNSQFFDVNANSFVPNTITQVDQSLILSANLGVMWNIGSKLSLKQSIGLGGSVIFRDTESNFDAFTDTFFSQRWLAKTGISYRLD